MEPCIHTAVDDVLRVQIDQNSVVLVPTVLDLLVQVLVIHGHQARVGLLHRLPLLGIEP